MSKPIVIRPALPSDADRIVEIEQTSPIRWDSNSLHKSLTTGETLLMAEVGEKVVGFIIGMIVADELQIKNIAVDPDHRRSGVARELILSLAELAHQAGAAICFLEVGENNRAAISFYRSLDFSNRGLRPKFYSDNEDALVMRAKLPDLLQTRRSK